MFLVSTGLSNAQLRLVYDFSGTGSASRICLKDQNFLYYSVVWGGVRRVVKTDGNTADFVVDIAVPSPTSGQYIRTNLISFDNMYYDNNGEIYTVLSNSASGCWIVKFLPDGNIQKVFDIKSILDSVTDSRFGYPTLLPNGLVVYSRINVTNNLSGTNGDEPLTLNLTSSASTILSNINNSFLSSNPKDFTSFNSKVYFSANNSTEGREIWSTDGTTTNTSLYLDVNTGSLDSNPESFNVLGGQLSFVATHNTLGRELFKSNGSGSLTLIRDINTTGDSNPSNIKKIGNLLYLSADNGSAGQELWKSDGTSLGTVLLKDINPSGSSNPNKFIQIGSTVYFIADDGTNGVELWKTDGTSTGTVLVKNINPSGSSNPNYLTEYNGKLYFVADNGTNGEELWVSDGTSTGTTMIEINAAGSSGASGLTVFNNELFLTANNGTVGMELFAYMDPSLSTNDFQLAGNAISLYPNPAKAHFELATTATVEKVEVYSLQGQLVKTFVNQNQYKINDLAKGMYIVKINAQEGIANKTLVIE